MSLLYVYKPLKDAWLSSLSRALLAAGVTPNIVTASGIMENKKRAAPAVDPSTTG